MKTEQLAVVQGWADTRGALRRWNAAPSVVLAPWALGAASLVAVLAARRDLGGRDALDARPLRRRRSPASRATRPSATTASCCSATASCSPCTRSRASPASWPARRCRRSPRATAASGARSTSSPARWRSRFVAAATLFSLATQAYALGGHASTLAADLGVSPARARARHPAARAARADRAVPPARRLDARQPRQALGRAARRHLRHHRDRDPDPAARGAPSRRGSRRACCSRRRARAPRG